MHFYNLPVAPISIKWTTRLPMLRDFYYLLKKKKKKSIHDFISRISMDICEARAAAPTARVSRKVTASAACIASKSRACGSAPITLNYHRGDHYCRGWTSIERDDNEDDFSNPRFHEARRGGGGWISMEISERVYPRAEKGTELSSPFCCLFERGRFEWRMR